MQKKPPREHWDGSPESWDALPPEVKSIQIRDLILSPWWGFFPPEVKRRWLDQFQRFQRMTGLPEGEGGMFPGCGVGREKNLSKD